MLFIKEKHLSDYALRMEIVRVYQPQVEPYFPSIVPPIYYTTPPVTCEMDWWAIQTSTLNLN
jgi:hypothetical protein